MKKVKFKKQCVIECCIGFDRKGSPIFEEEKIESGEEFNVEIIEENDDFIQIEFGNGSVSFIDAELIEIAG